MGFFLPDRDEVRMAKRQSCPATLRMMDLSILFRHRLILKHTHANEKCQSLSHN